MWHKLTLLGAARITSGQSSQLQLKPGDVVPVTENLGEGEVALCVGANITSASMEMMPHSRLTVHIDKFPRNEWWMKVTTPRGKSGYIQGPVDSGDYENALWNAFYIHRTLGYGPDVVCPNSKQ